MSDPNGGPLAGVLVFVLTPYYRLKELFRKKSPNDPPVVRITRLFDTSEAPDPKGDPKE